MFNNMNNKRVTEHLQGKGKPKNLLDIGMNIPKNIDDNKKIKPKDVFENYSSSSSSSSLSSSSSKTIPKSSSASLRSSKKTAKSS